jgi:hypothetical protein
MNAVPPSVHSHGSAAAPSPSAANAMSMRWAALADAGDVVAALAGVEPERSAAQMRNFPSLIRDADPWRWERAAQGVDDLAAIMEPGMAALLAVNSRGADPRCAALALLHEFNTARAALLALLPPTGAIGAIGAIA